MEKRKRQTYSTRNAGFTLIELMVVVAIIGVLSTVAITAFGNFAAKAKEIEGEVALRRVKTDEDDYYREMQMFTEDLAAIGYPINPLK